MRNKKRKERIRKRQRTNKINKNCKKILFISIIFIVIVFLILIALLKEQSDVDLEYSEEETEVVSILENNDEKTLDVDLDYSEEENITTLKIVSSVPITSAKKILDDNVTTNLELSYIVYSLEEDDSFTLSEDQLTVTKEYKENTKEFLFLSFDDGSFETMEITVDEIVEITEEVINEVDDNEEETKEDTSTLSVSTSNTSSSESKKNSTSSTSNTTTSNNSNSNTTSSSSSSNKTTSSSSSNSSSSYTSKYESYPSLAKEMLSYINSFREENGVSSLTWSDTLANYALIRADEIVENFSHTRPDGSTSLDWSIVYAENLGYSSFSFASMMAGQFESSSSHRETLLDSIYSTVGVACVRGSDGNYYWVELFGL